VPAAKREHDREVCWLARCRNLKYVHPDPIPEGRPWREDYCCIDHAQEDAMNRLLSARMSRIDGYAEGAWRDDYHKRCILAGCHTLRFVGPNGRIHDCCSRSCALVDANGPYIAVTGELTPSEERARNLPLDDKCELPWCFRERYMMPEGMPGPGSKRFCSTMHEAMDDVLASIFRKLA
jgi:hypothetical protein